MVILNIKKYHKYSTNKFVIVMFSGFYYVIDQTATETVMAKLVSINR